MVLIAAVVGFLGGAIHVWSGADHDLVGNLTFWQSGLLGSLTSICVYFVVTPNVGIKFIALSLIAGYGGKLIMDGLVNRAKLAVSQQENAKKDKKSGEVNKKPSRHPESSFYSISQSHPPERHVVSSLG